MHVDLVLLADCTAIHIFMDEGLHTRPPIIPLNKFLSLESSRVTSSGGIMVTPHNITAEVRVFRNIGPAFVGQNTPLKFPVV